MRAPHAHPPFPLREAHAHLAPLGESLRIPSLDRCTSVGECLQQIASARAAASPRPDGRPPFIRFTAARVQAWAEQRWPTLAELDAAAGGHPCVLLSFDYHAAAASSSALRAAGLSPGQCVGAGGRVVTDDAGSPTGLLLEDCAVAAWNAAPEPTLDQRLADIRDGLAHLRAHGFVEMHDLHSQPFLAPLLAQLDRDGELPLTVWLYPPLARIEADAAARSQWESPRVRLGGAKVFADGTLNSRTAFMLHRYAQPLPDCPRGRCMVSPAALDEAVRRVDRLGLPLAVHAIGDGAVRGVLDSIQRVRTTPDPGRSAGGIGRFRIEHAEIIDTRDVSRFPQLGVVCSVQPCHLLSDIEALTRFLPHRLDRVLPLRELIAAGCRPGPDGLLWFGSDAPIVPADPQDSIQAAVHRRRPGAPESDAVALTQALTPELAWRAFAAT